jgi:chromosome segregation ATPase
MSTIDEVQRTHAALVNARAALKDAEQAEEDLGLLMARRDLGKRVSEDEIEAARERAGRKRSEEVRVQTLEGALEAAAAAWHAERLKAAKAEANELHTTFTKARDTADAAERELRDLKETEDKVFRGWRTQRDEANRLSNLPRPQVLADALEAAGLERDPVPPTTNTESDWAEVDAAMGVG